MSMWNRFRSRSTESKLQRNRRAGRQLAAGFHSLEDRMLLTIDASWETQPTDAIALVAPASDPTVETLATAEADPQLAQATTVPEDLVEVFNRKARSLTAAWGPQYLQDASYLWQPETLMYIDQGTGHEVWRMTNQPGKETFWNVDIGVSPWSADGKTMSVHTLRNAAGLNQWGGRMWMTVGTDGSDFRPVVGAQSATYNKYLEWSPQRPDTYYEIGDDRRTLYESTITDNGIVSRKLYTFPVDVVIDKMVSGDGRKLLISSRDETRVYPVTIYPTFQLDDPDGYSIDRNQAQYGDTPASYSSVHDRYYAGDGTWYFIMPSGSSAWWKLKATGSASDGGPLYTGPDASNNFGEVVPVNTVGGTMSDPFGSIYWSHFVPDRWGRYALFSSVPSNPPPQGYGPGIWDIANSKYSVLSYGGGTQHHDWAGFTDWSVSSGGTNPYPSQKILAQKLDDPNSQIVVASAYTRYDGGTLYGSLARPGQSPDGTKAAWHTEFLNGKDSPDIYWGVVYKPYPATDLAAKTGGSVKVEFLPPKYTNRGWINPATGKLDEVNGETLYARETKQYRVWRSSSATSGWQPVGTVAAEYGNDPVTNTLKPRANGAWVSATNKISFNDAPSDGVWYYAVTSEEHSGLASDQLSEVLKVTVTGGKVVSSEIVQAKGQKDFWKQSVTAPANLQVAKQSTAGQYKLNWSEPGGNMVRYYNIYYSTSGNPQATQAMRIASLHAGTNSYLDWAADPSQQGYYGITTVDFYGNESAIAYVGANPVNLLPSANGDSYSTKADTALNIATPGVLSNDVDPERAALAASLVAGPANGTVTLNSNGSFVYTPKAGFTGTDSFTYRAYDGNAYSSAATVTIAVTSTSTPDVTGTMTVKTYNGTNTAPTVEVAGAANSFKVNARVSNDRTDTWTRVPAELAGQMRLLTARSDRQQSPVASKYVVNLSGPGDLYLAVDPRYAGQKLSWMDASWTTTTLTADSTGPYGNQINWTIWKKSISAAGDVTLGADTGLYDGITGVFVPSAIAPINTAPVATADGYSIDQDKALTVPAAGVLLNDTDADSDALAAALVAGPTNGTLTLNADGSFVYTPKAGFVGSDSFTYKANDGKLDSNVATVTITVNKVNRAPVAIADGYTIDQDKALSVPAAGVLLNDTDADGDALAAALVAGPTSGTLTLNADGSFVYTPKAGFAGSDSFTYKANDGKLDSNVATVTITVNKVNHAPVATIDGYTIDQDKALSVPAAGVLLNDTDADGDALAAALVTGPTNGTLTLNADGSFVYTPKAGFVGSDSFTYKANDGKLDSNVATVTITVKQTVPVSPTSLTAKADSSSQITLTWIDQSSNEAQFRIERKLGSTGTWATLTTVGVNATSFQDTNLAAGSTYFYRVCACNGAGNSASTNEASATTLFAPAVVGTMTLKAYNGTNTAPTVQAAGTANSFKVGALVVNDRSDTWARVPAELAGQMRLLTARADRRQAPVASKYVINLSGPGTLYVPLDPRYNGAKLSWMDASWTKTTMTADSSGLAGWAVWKKTITAAGDVTLGADTAVRDGITAVFVPSVVKQPPAAPTNAAAKADSTSQITLTWSDQSNNESGFKIERKAGSTGTWTQIAMVGANVTSYQDNGLATGTTYSYRVRAANADGDSAFSNEAGATTLANVVAGTMTVKTYNGTNTAPTVEAAGAANSFKAGALVSNDRPDTWTRVPAELAGQMRLLTARSDRQQSPVASKYVVNLSGPGDLYLAVDPRYAGQKLSWMDASWTTTTLTADSTGPYGNQLNWTIWKKSISAAGDVTLGADTGLYDGITAIFVPSAPAAVPMLAAAELALFSPTTATEESASMDMLADAPALAAPATTESTQSAEIERTRALDREMQRLNDPRHRLADLAANDLAAERVRLLESLRPGRRALNEFFARLGQQGNL